MNISESEIAILIPTYNSEIFISKCLTSAIESKAGEIIISDDNSSDNTKNLIKQFHDNRIKFYKNSKQLGLWENHFKLIKLASKPWIKFLQADDYLAENGLSYFCDNEENNLSIISALSINENLITKERKVTFTLSSKKRWTSKEYLNRLKIVGNELGTPSNTLIKKENIILNEKQWKTDISADLIMNVIAASKGDVVLLPPGPIIRVIHADQDTNRQNFRLFIDRLNNSVKILFNTNNIAIREFANIFYMVESIGIIRMISAQILRGKLNFAKYLLGVIKIKDISSLKILIRNISYIKKMLNWKYGRRDTFNLDF